MNIIGLMVAGIFFLGLGTYFLATFAGRSSSPNARAGLLFGAGGAVFIGLTLMWRGIQWARPLRETPQNTPKECPRCGALIDKNAAFCEKCRSQLSPNNEQAAQS
jgi:hypothetical protein